MNDSRKENALAVIEPSQEPSEKKFEEPVCIRRGDLYQSEEDKWRILDVRENGIMVINVVTKEIRLEEHNLLYSRVENGELKKISDDTKYFTLLSDAEMEVISEREDVIEIFLENLYPHWDRLFTVYMPKHYYKELMSVLSLSKRQLNRILIKYLLSGRNKYALADQRRNNHKHAKKQVEDLDVRKNTKFLYNFLLEEFKRTKSVQAAYDNMLVQHFRDPVFQEDGSYKMELIPDEEIPITYKMAHTYINSHLGGMTIKEWKKGKRDVVNNVRPLPGDAKYGVTKLGQRYECDEFEVPCYIIDEDTGETLGKPVVYVIVDVWAGIITGLHTGLDNNSGNGFRQAMISMMEPHGYQTIRYDMTYTEDEFPSLAIPREIRCDHGAEYVAKNLQRICDELDITIIHVPAKCGSLKGLVESMNGRIQVLLKDHARNEGVIKDDYRGGDIAKGEACMTLEDIRKIVYNTVIYINTKPIPNYSPTLAQAKAKIATTPASIYAFERKKSGDPTNIRDDIRDGILFSLLARVDDKRKFTVGRKGIQYTGKPLYFFSEEDWFNEMLRDKKFLENIEVRYDDTNIGAVYLCYKGIIRKVPLSGKRESQMEFMGLSWDEYDRIIKEFRESENAKEAERASKNRKLELVDLIEETAAMARALNGKGPKYGKAPKEAKAVKKNKLRKDPNEIINRQYAKVGEEKRETTEEQETIVESVETAEPVADVLTVAEKEPIPEIPEKRDKAKLTLEEEKKEREKKIAKYGPSYYATRENADFLARWLGYDNEED